MTTCETNEIKDDFLYLKQGVCKFFKVLLITENCAKLQSGNNVL